MAKFAIVVSMIVAGVAAFAAFAAHCADGVGEENEVKSEAKKEAKK